MSDKNNEEIKEEVKYKNFSEFLESNPPNQIIPISDLAQYSHMTTSSHGTMIRVYKINTPELQLYCEHDNCNGMRFFRCITTNGIYLNSDNFQYLYLTYLCSNCQENHKTFSLAAKTNDDNENNGQCYKFGELPTYGPPVPSKLIKLIGPDRDIFLKGRRCENQGLGIGAFVYYRRVIENQKNRIISEIIKVSKKINTSQEKIETLENSLKETQFTKALNMAKDALPESLLINGHSPILLLHNALSKGVHALNDEECLELAESIRVVLGELSDRLSQALKDEEELTRALSKLMHKNS